jgi:hypothetical protein
MTDWHHGGDADECEGFFPKIEMERKPLSSFHYFASVQLFRFLDDTDNRSNRSETFRISPFSPAVFHVSAEL